MKNNDNKKKVLFRYLKDKINLIIHIFNIIWYNNNYINYINNNIIILYELQNIWYIF